jgi:DNA-binding CsgD family transcriptional regulator
MWRFVPEVTESWDGEAAYRRLALALKALGGGLWDYDIDADQLSCNRRWYEIMGLDESTDPIHSIGAFRPHIHPDDVERATAVDFDQVSRWLANDEIYHVDFRIIRPDGSVRAIRSVASLTQNTTSAHRTAVGCITDVTDANSFDATHIDPQKGAYPGVEESRDEAIGTEEFAPRLTLREKECLMWVSLGKTARESGLILGTSRRTVEFHLNNAVRKLAAANKIHAAALAIRMGII